MKRISNIFDEIISIDNLRLAHYEAKASRKPRRRKGAKRFELNLEENLQRLHDALADETWTMHPYRCMTRIERGKEREIYYSPDMRIPWFNTPSCELSADGLKRRSSAMCLHPYRTEERMTLSSYWGIIKWISRPNQFWFTFFNNHLTQLEVSL